VADALAVNVGGRSSGGQKRIGGTRNEDALDAYLRGQALYKLGRDEASDRAALTQFDRALALDPRYGAAQAARSRALTVIANTYASGDALKALYDKAIAAAKGAVDLAPELAEGHAALGFALFNGRLDVAAAKVPYGKSFELGFGNADILAAFANFAGRTGMFDAARKAIGRAQKLDPLNAGVFRNAGSIEYAARNYDAALAALRAALSINPDQSGVHVVLGDMHLIGGRIAQAREEYSREANELTRLRGLAIADMRLGNRFAADAGLAAMIGEFGDNSLYQQTQIYAQWNRHGEALDALERALLVGDSGLVQSRNDPLLDPLRGDARFSSVLRQLGFE
jgi:tetratricopeptide (TPR) repeat protein